MFLQPKVIRDYLTAQSLLSPGRLAGCLKPHRSGFLGHMQAGESPRLRAVARTPYFIHILSRVLPVSGAPPPASPLSRNALRVSVRPEPAGGTGGEGCGGRVGRVTGIRVGTPEELSHHCPHASVLRGSEVGTPNPALCRCTNPLETSCCRCVLMRQMNLCLR